MQCYRQGCTHDLLKDEHRRGCCYPANQAREHLQKATTPHPLSRQPAQRHRTRPPHEQGLVTHQRQKRRGKPDRAEPKEGRAHTRGIAAIVVAAYQIGPNPREAGPRTREIAAIIASTSNAAGAQSAPTKTASELSPNFTRTTRIVPIPDQALSRMLAHKLGTIVCLNTVARKKTTQAADNYALSTT